MVTQGLFLCCVPLEGTTGPSLQHYSGFAQPLSLSPSLQGCRGGLSPPWGLTTGLSPPWAALGRLVQAPMAVERDSSVSWGHSRGQSPASPPGPPCLQLCSSTLGTSHQHARHPAPQPCPTPSPCSPHGMVDSMILKGFSSLNNSLILQAPQLEHLTHHQPHPQRPAVRLGFSFLRVNRDSPSCAGLPSGMQADNIVWPWKTSRLHPRERQQPPNNHEQAMPATLPLPQVPEGSPAAPRATPARCAATSSPQSCSLLAPSLVCRKPTISGKAEINQYVTGIWFSQLFRPAQGQQSAGAA